MPSGSFEHPYDGSVRIEGEIISKTLQTNAAIYEAAF
jgi:hypothetical protein